MELSIVNKSWVWVQRLLNFSVKKEHCFFFYLLNLKGSCVHGGSFMVFMKSLYLVGIVTVVIFSLASPVDD